MGGALAKGRLADFRASYTPRIGENVSRALGMLPNTAPFDVTGHPAMTVPCGVSEGLPVGMMLVGRHWDEQTVLRAARAFEKLGKFAEAAG